MQATIELPDEVASDLDRIAARNGVSAIDWLRQVVLEKIEQQRPQSKPGYRVQLPLIPASRTGPIGPFTGADIDELFASDELSS